MYLVVRKSSGKWEFPQAAHAPGETVRQARSPAPVCAAELLLPRHLC